MLFTSEIERSRKQGCFLQSLVLSFLHQTQGGIPHEEANRKDPVRCGAVRRHWRTSAQQRLEILSTAGPREAQEGQQVAFGVLFEISRHVQKG